MNSTPNSRPDPRACIIELEFSLSNTINIRLTPSDIRVLNGQKHIGIKPTINMCLLEYKVLGPSLVPLPPRSKTPKRLLASKLSAFCFSLAQSSHKVIKLDKCQETTL